MKRLLIFSFAVTLSGCSVTEPQYPEPLRDKVYTSIEIVDSLPNRCSSSAYACIIHAGGIGSIYIRRDIYPACITHEILHLFSDDWHGKNASDEYCTE